MCLGQGHLAAVPASMTGSSLEDPSTSYLAITVTKTWDSQVIRRKGLFWLTVSQGFSTTSQWRRQGGTDRFMAVGVAEISYPEDQEAVIMRQEVNHVPVTDFCHPDPIS